MVPAVPPGTETRDQSEKKASTQARITDRREKHRQILNTGKDDDSWVVQSPHLRRQAEPVGEERAPGTVSGRARPRVGEASGGHHQQEEDRRRGRHPRRALPLLTSSLCVVRSGHHVTHAYLVDAMQGCSTARWSRWLPFCPNVFSLCRASVACQTSGRATGDRARASSCLRALAARQKPRASCARAVDCSIRCAGTYLPWQTKLPSPPRQVTHFIPG